MSRTRLIRPEFFADELMARLSVSTRLVYIGLWTLCDDAGYFELEPRQIAAELFRFDGPSKRDRVTAVALDDLVAATRVSLLPCGEHAVIPTIPDHRIKGGEALYTIKKRHERRCSVAPPKGYVAPGYVGPTEDSIPDSVSDSDSVSVSSSAQARTTKLADAALEAGGFVGRLAARRNGTAKEPTKADGPAQAEPDWLTTPGSTS